MAEEIYRQERKPIRPEEAKESLARAHQVQKELGYNVPDNEPVIKGNIPPQVQEELERRRRQETGEDPPVEEKSKKFAPAFNYKTSNPDLDEIFAKLRDKTGRYEEIVLPSLGRFYNGSDGPTDGKIHVRPMTGNEEMILGTPRYLKKGVALDMIFQECVKEAIQPSKLLTVDRTFILIYLRGISIGHEYEVDVRCPECTTSFGTTIDLNLPVETCPEEFTQANLEDKFPNSGLRFKYRLSTGSDEQAVTDHQEKRIKQFGDNATDDTILFRMALLVEAIEHVKGVRLVQSILQRLPMEDVNYLRGLIIDPPFGPNTRIQLFCPSCNHEFEVNLPVDADFFFPRRRKDRKELALHSESN
jgi:hypothetical protein